MFLTSPLIVQAMWQACAFVSPLKVNECYGDVTSTILASILLLYFYLVMDLDIESIALTTLKWPSCRVPESFKRAR